MDEFRRQTERPPRAAVRRAAILAALAVCVGTGMAAQPPDDPALYLKGLLERLPPSAEWERWLKQTGEPPPLEPPAPRAAYLPDPLRFASGQPVRTLQDWQRRRAGSSGMAPLPSRRPYRRHPDAPPGGFPDRVRETSPPPAVASTPLSRLRSPLPTGTGIGLRGSVHAPSKRWPTAEVPPPASTTAPLRSLPAAAELLGRRPATTTALLPVSGRAPGIPWEALAASQRQRPATPSREKLCRQSGRSYPAGQTGRIRASMQMNVNICTQFLPDSICSFSIQAMPCARRQAGPGRSLLPAERGCSTRRLCAKRLRIVESAATLFSVIMRSRAVTRGREMQPMAGPHVRSGRRRQVRDPRWQARLPAASRTCRGSTEGGGVIMRTAAA